MAKLNAAARNRLPDSAFAGKNRTFPVEDFDHARDAKARASEDEKRGYISASEEAHIDARADAVLKEHPLHP